MPSVAKISVPPIPEPALDSDTLRDLLLEYRERNWRGIQTPEVRQRVVEETLRDDGANVLRQVEAFWKLPVAARVLDIGSGVGTFVAACRSRGLQAVGIEPDRIGQGAPITSIQIARRRFKTAVFAAAVGESLPFADACFDLVTMNQVLEHVTDQMAVVQEAFRVLKPGGAMYIACPNYLRFYESHYKLFWLPLLPKRVGRWYLRLRGRNPILLGQITYTTNRRVRRLLAALASNSQVVDIHREQFLRKLSHGSFASLKSRVVAKVARLPVVGRLVIHLVLLFLRLREGGCEMLVLRTA